jgi:kynureninase
MSIIDSAAKLGPGPLTEASLREHIFPLFSKTLAAPGIYLENHSLGRPLDQTADDVREAVTLWQTKLGSAWDDWMQAENEHRARIATIIGAPRPDCVVPKVSAGQGLRAVLNALPGIPRVLATTGEFDSVDVILKQYAAAGRIHLRLIHVHAPDGSLNIKPLEDAIAAGADLVIVPQVFFLTAQIIPNLDRLAAYCHQHNARLLVDAYHAIGVFPVDVNAMQADFVIGGSYKYLRGGPGAAFLYLSPAFLSSKLRPLDIGWFAKEHVFGFDRPDVPQFASGGNGFLESTPVILSYYQARAGQQFTLAIGIDRIRAYTLNRLQTLKHSLAQFNVMTHGGDESHGAFLTLPHANATDIVNSLHKRGIHADARPGTIRLSPDLLSTEAEIRTATQIISEVMK